MKCSINDCGNKTYKNSDECSFHRQLRLWGQCIWPHKKIKPAHGTDGLCQQCRKRGHPMTLHFNTICFKCNKRKVVTAGLCNFCSRKEKYGMCIYGCNAASNDRSGECANCKSRGGPPKNISKRINSDKNKWCNRCKKMLTADNFYLQKRGGKSLAKYCKTCNSNNYRIRMMAWNYGKNNVIQTSFNLCVRCWDNLGDWEVDHILPRSLGGSNNASNLQIMCKLCNRKKGNKESIDYRKWINHDKY
jgi:hypothetical protein